MSSGSRIVIDPDGVRRLATRMRGGAFIFSNSGRTLAGTVLPPMPASLADHVSEAIREANAALQDLAVELIEDAVHLEARATWAELGGGAETAWLIPGLRRYPSLPTVSATLVDEVAAVTEEQIRASQEWAVEMLDGMPDSVGALADDHRADDHFGKSVVDVIETYADEIPIKPLGGFTLVAAAVAEMGEHGGGARGELGAQSGIDAGSGAVGSSLSILFSSPTGWGVAGCLLAGGLVTPPFEGRVEDG